MTIIKKFISITFLLISYSVSHAEPQSFPTEYFSPSNIAWSQKELPNDIKNSKTFKDWLLAIGVEGNQYSVRWANVSIVRQDSKEIIVQNLVPNSGGMNVLILIKKNETWKSAVDFVGGFVIYPASSKSSNLIVYTRSGLEYLRSEFKYANGTYKLKSKSEVPIEITRLNNSPIDFYNYFWYLNTGVKK